MLKLKSKLIAVLLALLPPATLAQDFMVGLQAYQAENYQAALKEIRPLAEQGHGEAQYLLGRMYSAGNDIPQGDGEVVAPWRKINTAKGLPWYRKAAEQGHAGAQSQLGSAYYTGDSVTQNVHEAVKWFEKSGEQGDAFAQAMLGQIYYDGAHLKLFGMPMPSYTEALTWRQRAADQGHYASQYQLGMMYYDGKGTPQHYDEAARWFRSSAEQGNRAAQSAALVGCIT